MEPKRVLVIDDEESIRTSLQNLLSSDNVHVSTSAAMEDAERQIRETPLDLVIADLRLTGMLGVEGLELISYVKEKRPDTHVILMTAYGSPGIEEEARRRGAADYWEKPVEIAMMLNKLRELGIPVEGGE